MRRTRVWSGGSALRAMVVVALVATGTVASATAAFADAGITVSPKTGLVDGQSVNVHGSGWDPGATVAFCEGSGSPPNADPGYCAGGGFAQVNADSNGNFDASLVVARAIFVPSLNATVDCGALSNPCWVGAAVTVLGGLTATLVPIAFAPGCPALVAAPHTHFTLSAGDGVGSVATFVADHDYALVGSATLTCQPNLSWSGAPPTAQFTGTPVLTPGTGALIEGNSGVTLLDVPITLSDAVANTVTATWRTVFVPGAPGNQADPATDYIPFDGVVTFAPGETTAHVSIGIDGDTVAEPDEYIVVQFGAVTNGKVGGFYGLGFGIITNDDHVVVAPGSAAVLEGNSGPTDLEVPVTLSNPSSVTVTVQWTTAVLPGGPGNQADSATDYTPASGTVTFAPGETTATVPISVNGDTTVEPDEYIVVHFGNVTNGKIGGFYGLGFGVITNDD